MDTPHRDQISFLLRLWRADLKIWRASLDDPMTGERKGFSDIEALIVFLRSLTVEFESIGEKNEQTPDS